MVDQAPLAVPAPRRGLARFLFRTPLGILLVLATSLVLCVALAPTIAAAVGPGRAGAWFADHYRGTLRIGAARLGWFGEQSLEGVELVDPAGARVAKVDVRLPGLFALATGGGKRLGKISVVAEAALEADANGKTNLDRALEPREGAGAGSGGDDAGGGSGSEAGDSSSKDFDLELDVRVTRLSWSDERTRAAGAPFEIKDLSLAAALRPGEPLSAKLAASLSGAVGSAGGKLALEARVEHPFDAPSSPTPPRADVRAEIAGFPVALVDALARQGGRLSALLGDELALTLAARGGADQGDFELSLSTPRTQLSAKAGLQNGVLRLAGDGVQARVELTDAFLASVLPREAGAPEIARASGAGPVTLSLTELEASIGPWLEANARGDEHALDSLLWGVRARFALSLGDWSVVDPAHLGGAEPLAIGGVALAGELLPPDQPSAIRLACTAASGANAPGRVELTANFQDGAALAAFAPSRALAPVSLRVALADWPTALVDRLSKTEGDLSRALGERVSLTADVRAELAAGDDARLDWASIGARWRELARRATADLSLKLSGTPKGEALAALGGQSLALHELTAGVTLAPGAPVKVRANLRFDAPTPGSFELRADVSNALADDAKKSPLAFAVKARAAGLSSRAAGAFAGRDDDLEQLLGASLALALEADGTLDAGRASLDLVGERSRLRFAGELRDGTLVHAGEGALAWHLEPDPSLLGEFTKNLPAGTRLAFANASGAKPASIDVLVPELSLPLRELTAPAPAGASAADALLGVLLAKSRVQASVAIGGLDYQDAELTAAGRRIERASAKLELALAPRDGRPSTALTLKATLASPSLGASPIVVTVDAPDATVLPGIAEGKDFEPIALTAALAGLPTALLDAYAGGALAGPLGDKLSLDVQASLAQPANAPFAVQAALALTGSAGASRVTLAAQVKDPLNRRGSEAARRPEGVPPELEAQLDVSGAGALLAFAPEGSRELARELCGETIAGRFAVRASGPASKAGSAPDLSLDATLDAGRIRLDGAADLRAGVLASVEKRPIALSVAPSARTLELLVAGKLPAGAALALAEKDGALTLKLEGISAPIGEFLAADAATRNARLVEGTAARITLGLPTLVYTHPPAAAKPGEAPPAATSVKLSGITCLALLAPKAPAKVDLTGAVEAEPRGTIEAHAVIDGPAGFLATPIAAGSRAVLDAKLSRFPSAIVDALADQDGLIVDVLGPELEAVVRGAYPDDGVQPIHAKLTSNLGVVQLDSRLADGVIVCQGEQGLDAKVGLTPLFSQRVVGSLVPMFVQVRQDDPAHRTLLTGKNLALPLDADLSKLSGDLVLDLGAIEYDLLPGLKQAFALAGKEAPGTKSTVVPPIAIRVVDGVARYDGIPVRIAGRDVSFRGKSDLAKRTFELGFNVPLEMLGSKVESQLEQVRDYLDPKMEVPLELYGSWTSPRVRLGAGFLEKALKKAGEGALERGLGGLLGGDDKKKKKKKDG